MKAWVDGGFVRIDPEARKCIRCKKAKMSTLMQFHNSYSIATYCRPCWEKDLILEGWERPKRTRAKSIY
jgi:hypothetical protein